MFVALAMGLLSQMPGHSHGIADIAPADFVANQLVAAAELVARRGPGPRALLISHATTSGNASSLVAPLRWRVCNFEVPRMIAQVRTYLLTYLLTYFVLLLPSFLPSLYFLPSLLSVLTHFLTYLRRWSRKRRSLVHASRWWRPGLGTPRGGGSTTASPPSPPRLSPNWALVAVSTSTTPMTSSARSGLRKRSFLSLSGTPRMSGSSRARAPLPRCTGGRRARWRCATAPSGM